MDLLKKVDTFSRQQSLFLPAMKLLVAVSGGPDSTALLYILCQLREHWGLQIFVAHFDHGLRSESKKDKKFVHDLCDRWDLPLVLGQGIIKKGSGSIEEKARNARFDFLIKTSKKIKADAIVLGHTQDDVAETILMRVLRGTGLLGLRGILPQRIIQGVMFVRPLLCASKKEILGYLKTHRLKFRMDRTNKSRDFFRNKIRLDLVPAIEKSYSPNIKELLAGLAQTSAVDYEYLYDQALKACKKLKLPSKPHRQVCIPLNSLRSLPLSIRRMVIRIVLQSTKGDLRRFTYSHMSEIEDLIEDRCSGSIVHLPGGIIVLKNKLSLIFKRKI